jgi:RNA polymerase sigma-70 factor (ECF subfamily)
MRGKPRMTIPPVDRIRGVAVSATSKSDDALEKAFDEHWASVCESLYYLVGDSSEAQDLALEAFWRLHTRPPRNMTNVGGWLHRVATNLGLNAIRARNRRQRYEEAAGDLRAQRAEPIDPAQEAERREIREQVRHVLSRMPRRKAEILVLRQTDHTYAEIAQALGVAPGSVGTMLARAEREFERRYRSLEDVV